MDEQFTTAELARLFHVAEGSIRRWASEDRIPGQRRGRAKVYRHSHIQRAYDRRHPEPADTTH